MATSAMLWGGASYNNGILPFKRYILGESYSRESEGGTIKSSIEVTPEMAEFNRTGSRFRMQAGAPNTPAPNSPAPGAQ